MREKDPIGNCIYAEDKITLTSGLLKFSHDESVLKLRMAAHW